MANGGSYKSEVIDLARRLDIATIGLLNKTAKEYMAALNQYLANISIVVPRTRLSDSIPLDRSIGIAWVVLIPILYFVTVGLILGSLLCFFWYKEKTGSETSRASDNPSVFEPINNEGRSGNIDNAPLPGVFVRSYLTSAGEFVASPRSSVASKGSTRSLGVLTGRDLDFPAESRSSLRNIALTTQTRRMSKSIPELQEDGDHSGQMNKSNGSFKLRNPDKAMLKAIDLLAPRSNSLSSGSLEDNVSRDSLRASMESHKLMWMSGGRIKSDDMYNISISPPSCQCKDKSDIPDLNINNDIFTKKDAGRKLQHVFEKTVITDEKVYLLEVDNHLKKMYEDSLNVEDKQNKYSVAYHKDKNTFPVTNSEIPHNFSSDSVATNLPVSLLLLHPNTETSLASDVETSKKVSQKAESAAEALKAKRCLFSSNTGTNVDELPLPILHTNTHVKQLPLTSLHANNNIEAVSQLSSHIYENESALGAVSMKGLEVSQHYQFTQSCNQLDIQNLEISSASQVTTASSQDFGQSGLSEDSSDGEEDDSCVNISLPSSISRFHASKVGAHPTPTAGYPLASTQNYTPGLIQSASQGSQVDSQSDDINNDSFSVCPNVGSYSQSIAPLSCTFGSSENSLEFLKGREIHSVNRNDSKDSADNIKACLFPTCQEADGLMSQSKVSKDDDQATQSLLMGSEAKPQPRRRRSFDFITSEKVTVEQRLKEFGFIKAKGKNKYVVNPSPGKFNGRRRQTDHVSGSEDGNHWSFNCIETSDRSGEGQCNANSQDRNGGLVESDRTNGHPKITEVLNASSNYSHIRSDLEDISLFEQKKDLRDKRQKMQNDHSGFKKDEDISQSNDSVHSTNAFRLNNVTQTVRKGDTGSDLVVNSTGQPYNSIGGVSEKGTKIVSTGMNSYEKGEFSDSTIFDWAIQLDEPKKSEAQIITNVVPDQNKASKHSANRIKAPSKTSMIPIKKGNNGTAKNVKISRQRSKKSLVFGGFQLGFVGDKAASNFKRYSNEDFLSATNATEPLVTKEADPTINDRSRHSFVNASYEDPSLENDKIDETNNVSNESRNSRNITYQCNPNIDRMNPLQFTRRFSDEANTTSKLHQFGQNRISSIDLFAKVSSESRDSDFFARQHPSLMTPSTPEKQKRVRRKN